MIKINLSEKEYSFPQSWEEVSYEKYMQLNSNDELNYMYKNIIDVSILSGIPQETLEELSLEEFMKFDISWMSNFPSANIKNEWIFGGEKYVVHNFDDMTTREYYDATHFAKNPKTFDKMLAVILRPETEEKYNPKLLNKRADMLKKELNAAEVQKVIGFFLNGTGGLLNHLTTFLYRLKEMEEKEKKDGDC